MLATGSHARRLSELPGELTLRGLDDALALRARLASKPSVVVIGGGPLGMEVASGALAAGCRVTVVSQGVPLTGQLAQPSPRSSSLTRPRTASKSSRPPWPGWRNAAAQSVSSSPKAPCLRRSWS
ncbi:NAD(P)/FAD-dependent oxidoreductase [Actinospica durhamensis]|uniref:NAD(P)/FAD-dependent oxidoreductase n=1 Tax=Actinospica durhamensis TaxID=1508375 RepID=A0A941EX60_9ACTN|nr:NAD(P)/FAD-dependent oxidoreductase [Actinospica durhamensis]